MYYTYTSCAKPRQNTEDFKNSILKAISAFSEIGNFMHASFEIRNAKLKLFANYYIGSKRLES